MFCPVHIVGHQLDDGGVDSIDPHLETSQQALALASGRKVGLGVLELGVGRRVLVVHLPEVWGFYGGGTMSCNL